MWVVAESLGYVVNFDPYQGAKNGMSTSAGKKTWGLGETVVLSLSLRLYQRRSATEFSWINPLHPFNYSSF